MSYGSRVKLEDKVLHFEFNFQQVQFNKNGKYFLRFTVQNFHREDLLSMVIFIRYNSYTKLFIKKYIKTILTSFKKTFSFSNKQVLNKTNTK